MASAASSDDPTQPLRATEYSAIPITNVQAPNSVHTVKDDHQSFLRRMRARRTAIVIALVVTLCCGLIARERVNRNYNRAMRDYSNLLGTTIFEEMVAPELPYVRTETTTTSSGQGPRKSDATSYTDPPYTVDITRPDGTHIVASIYPVPASQIYPGVSITATGVCPKKLKIRSCKCPATVRGCLVGHPKLSNGDKNGCQCEYRGTKAKCHYWHHTKQAKLLVITFCG